MDPQFKESTVAVFHLPIIDDELKCTHLTRWSIKELADLDNEVRKVKNKIDKPYAENRKRWERITQTYEPSWPIATRLRKHMPRITNAGSKIYEILSTFHDDIFHDEMKEIVHFDNGAMPGMFPYTINYYVQTKTTAKYTWYASSLIEGTTENPKPLKDSYNLRANYPDNWIMGDGNNGDVMDPAVQRNFREVLPKVDLYTSDIGFDVSIDYNEQETIHSPVNLGQVVSGLIVLKKGGTLITKQYTYFTGFTISLMGYLTRYFEKLYVVKPLTSKPDNSETYLVGIGFTGITDNEIDQLLMMLPKAQTVSNKNKITPMLPMFQKKCISNDFINAIVASSKHFYGAQIDKINSNLGQYNSNEKINHVSMKKIVDKWFDINSVVPLPKSAKNLNTTSSKRGGRQGRRH